MKPNRMAGRRGFTLIELMVTILIASIVVLGVASVMADAHRGYNRMYQRIHGNVITEAYTARMRFDAICRKASSGGVSLDTSIPMLEVYYYSVPNVHGDADLLPDLYAQFYLNGTSLMLARGDIVSGAVIATEVLATNVTELKFSADSGRSVQMVMTLDDGRDSITVTCGSMRHN